MKEYLQLIGNDTPCAPLSAMLWSEEHRIAFNCPEGMQRFCGEIKTRLNRVSTFFFTRVDVHSVMGLPGVIFTVNDVGIGELEIVEPSSVAGGERSSDDGSSSSCNHFTFSSSNSSSSRDAGVGGGGLVSQFWHKCIRPAFFHFRVMKLNFRSVELLPPLLSSSSSIRKKKHNNGGGRNDDLGSSSSGGGGGAGGPLPLYALLHPTTAAATNTKNTSTSTTTSSSTGNNNDDANNDTRISNDGDDDGTIIFQKGKLRVIPIASSTSWFPTTTITNAETTTTTTLEEGGNDAKKATSSSSSSSSSARVLSYLCYTTQELRFLPALAKASGVNPGPKYQTLKRGESVESDLFPGRIVQPTEVLCSELSEVPTVLILDVDDVEGLTLVEKTLRRLVALSSSSKKSSSKSSSAESSSENSSPLFPMKLAMPHTIIHLTPNATLLQSREYCNTIANLFPEAVTKKHVAKLHLSSSSSNGKIVSSSGRKSMVMITEELHRLHQEVNNENENRETTTTTTTAAPRTRTLDFVSAFPTALLHRLHLHLVAPSFFPIAANSCQKGATSETEGDDGRVWSSQQQQQPALWPYDRVFFVNTIDDSPPQPYISSHKAQKQLNKQQQQQQLSQQQQKKLANNKNKNSQQQQHHDEKTNSNNTPTPTTTITPATVTTTTTTSSSSSLSPPAAIIITTGSGGGNAAIQTPTLESARAMLSKQFQEQLLLAESTTDVSQNSTLPSSSSSASFPPEGELIFFGTGSAIPSKYRNVSAFLYLPQDPTTTTTTACMIKQKAKRVTGGTLMVNKEPIVLCDCGEGTLGQMHNYFLNGSSCIGGDGDGGGDTSSSSSFGYLDESILPSLGLVFISHMHADHHLGFFSILHRRNQGIIEAKRKKQKKHKKNPTPEAPKGASSFTTTATSSNNTIGGGGGSGVPLPFLKASKHEEAKSKAPMAFPFHATKSEQEERALKGKHEEEVLPAEQFLFQNKEMDIIGDYIQKHLVPEMAKQQQNDDENDHGAEKQSKAPSSTSCSATAQAAAAAAPLPMDQPFASSLFVESEDTPNTNMFLRFDGDGNENEIPPPLLVLAPQEFIDFAHRLSPILGVDLSAEFVLFEVFLPTPPSLLLPIQQHRSNMNNKEGGAVGGKKEGVLGSTHQAVSDSDTTFVALHCKPQKQQSASSSSSWPPSSFSWLQQFCNATQWEITVFPVDHPAIIVVAANYWLWRW